MWLHRYTRWDGTQEVFPIDEDQIMEQLSEHLLGQGDVSAALRSLVQRGVRGRDEQHLSGIQDLIQSLRQQRQQLMGRYKLDSVLEDIRHQLGEVRRLEQQGIDRRLREMEEKLSDLQKQGSTDGLEEELLKRVEGLAQKNRQFIEQLPSDPASAIARLTEYEFMSPEAQEKFDELLRSLQEQVLTSHFQDLSQGLQQLSPEESHRLKEMTRELNRMLEERARGGQPNFQSFMQKYGDLFGPKRPATLEQLVEGIQTQLAQMESLLNSLAPEQRRELQDLLDAAFSDPALRDELSRLAANLEYLRPIGSQRRHYPFRGDEPLSLQEARTLMEQLQKMEDLERQLRRIQHGGNLTDVDPELVNNLLGTQATQELERLKGLTELLQEAGYIRSLGNRFELTPRGMRKMGQTALQEIFAYIKQDQAGQHDTQTRGVGVERREETKPYEFGDPFDLDLKQTLFNSMFHEGPGVPLRLQPPDFQVHRSQQLALSSTVLMLDLSLSMAMRGNFLAAKKVALALDNLIRTRFPRDILHIVGFSTYAREVKPEKLAYLTWDEFDPYTNIQHGLALSQRLLSRVSGGTKQIIMISDGEPTAHVEGGQLFLQYPPNPRTIRETLHEVKRCTSKGITINTFMLDRNSYLVEFVEKMSRINRGRVFYTSPDRLGHYILVDYFTSRRRVLA